MPKFAPSLAAFLIGLALVLAWGFNVFGDWATDISTGSGGVYDGPITSLAFDNLGWLFVGTTACVNILFPNATVNHLSRFQGLPYNETTSVAIEYNTRACIVCSLSD